MINIYDDIVASVGHDCLWVRAVDMSRAGVELARLRLTYVARRDRALGSFGAGVSGSSLARHHDDVREHMHLHKTTEFFSRNEVLIIIVNIRHRI